MADRRLQVFRAVAQHLSFTKAADALFMTQPAVTFQIKQLEESFNARLFDRAHGGVTLTAAGVMAGGYAARILGPFRGPRSPPEDKRGPGRGRARGPAPLSTATCKRQACRRTPSTWWSSSAARRR